MTPSGWVLGVDSGGSELRIALARVDDQRPADRVICREPVRTGPAGIDAGHLLEQLLPAARALLARAGAGAGALTAATIGAAGMATLGENLRAELPGALTEALGVRRLALAADAVTAYAGAIGQRPGVVVAAGTGVIALGTNLGEPGDPSGGWRRADGWGHLLGDCGGGSWVGRAGLEAALRAYDGRDGGSTVLLARLEAMFGPPPQLPGLLYPRTDRPAVLASFAPEVGRCAADDPVAADILRRAATHIADAAGAVCPLLDGCSVGLTGGLLRMGPPLLGPLHEELARRLPHARLVEAAGDPLDGALSISVALASDNLLLPADARMLHITDHSPA